MNQPKNSNYSLNVAIAMMMLSIFGDEIEVDHNEEQGLVTLTNAAQDCYVTITKQQHDNLFNQLGNVATDMEDGEDNALPAGEMAIAGDEELMEGIEVEQAPKMTASNPSEQL